MQLYAGAGALVTCNKFDIMTKAKAKAIAIQLQYSSYIGNRYIG